MNDRFKFRVWDKENKKLYDWDFLEKTKKDNTFFWCLHQAQNDCKHNILMQSTGLKDKNGKLIYEGDILKVADGSINGNILYFTKPVKWEINRWVNCPYWLYRETDKTHFAEIIGNIYENEDLLNE